MPLHIPRFERAPLGFRASETWAFGDFSTPLLVLNYLNYLNYLFTSHLLMILPAPCMSCNCLSTAEAQLMLFAMRLTGWRSRVSGTVKWLKCVNFESVYQNPSILLTLLLQDHEAPMLSLPLSDEIIGVCCLLFLPTQRHNAASSSTRYLSEVALLMSSQAFGDLD